ncbi:MAG: NAD(P)H-hydrate dehydratase [Deltaproteobacteria bacterium]|nr:NAD(P)H-hydrate dehydratase [Deltaproteobacteria bacterium]
MELLVTRARMRRYDAVAQEKYGIDGLVLMENAGRGAAEVIRTLVEGLPRRPRAAAPRIGIVCGPGNNGGDGFVVARHLSNAGLRVLVYLTAPAERVGGDAARNLAVVRAMGLDLVDVSGDGGSAALRRALAHDAVVVDGLFGTGLDREVTGRPREVIEAMNAAPGTKVALDVPSGLDADSGRPLGVCVHADHTVTFGHLKLGLAVYPGLELAGTVHVTGIGAPEALGREVGFDALLLDAEAVPAMLPARPRDGHKGTFGHLLVVAGSRGKSGAAVMTAQAGVRTGAGLVTIAATGDVRASIEARVRETMVEELISNGSAPGDEKAFEARWNVLARGKTAVALGPGCGTDEAITAAIRRIVAGAKLPMVVDADGLNALAERPDLVRTAPAPRILTPHPGEMARLIGATTADVQADRIGTARRVAADWNAVVVLKGARTVIAAPDGRVFVNPTGNPGMASGGSGDVLTGIIGGLLAQRVDALDAACAGAFVHGGAGDEAAEGTDGRGLAARDLIAHLPRVLRRLASHL